MSKSRSPLALSSKPLLTSNSLLVFSAARPLMEEEKGNGWLSGTSIFFLCLESTAASPTPFQILDFRFQIEVFHDIDNSRHKGSSPVPGPLQKYPVTRRRSRRR